MLHSDVPQSCLQCPLSFPRSKLQQHVLSQHPEYEVQKDKFIENEYMDDDDMELDEDDEDVKQFLEDIDNAHEELEAFSEDDTEIPDSELTGCKDASHNWLSPNSFSLPKSKFFNVLCSTLK